jgi:CPA1 family monovalent cation:H+ antiporter
MMIGNVGAKRGMSPTTREAVFSFWEFAAFLANSFVFILIGLEIDLLGFWGDAGLILLFFATMIFVRAMVVMGVSTFVRREDLRLRRSWLPVITWAGIRGSLSMVLAMMLVATTDIGGAHRETILNIVYGVVLLSILAQGTTMAWLMKRAGLIIETHEEIEYEMALARRQAIRRLLDELEDAEKKGTLSLVTYDRLHDQLLVRRQANDQCIAEMLEHTSSLNNLELQMHTNHLRALEKQVYRDLEKEGALDYETMESLVRDVAEQKPKKDEDSHPE